MPRWPRGSRTLGERFQKLSRARGRPAVLVPRAMASLQGRRVLLTGASRGVGRETVKLFSREGAEIIGVARDAARLAALAREYPSFQAATGDITDRTLGARLAQLV